MPKLQHNIEMLRGWWSVPGTANVYNELAGISARIDTTAYDGDVTFYFDASLRNTGANGVDIAYVELYNHTDGVSVAGSELSHNENVVSIPKQMRSGPITLSGDKIYTVRVKHSASATNLILYGARVIVVQTGTITKTQIHQELGNEFNISNTTVTNRDVRTMPFVYDGTKYDGTITVRHDVVCEPGNGVTASSGIYDETGAAVLSGSTVSSTGTGYQLLSSGTVGLVSGRTYRPTTYVSSGSATFQSNKLVFTLTNFTKYIEYLPLYGSWLLNTTSTGGYYDGSWLQRIDTSDSTGCQIKYYFEVLLRTSVAAHTAGAVLISVDQQTTASDIIFESYVSHTGNTTYTRLRSGAVPMFPGARLYGLALQVSNSSATGTLYNGNVIREVSGIGDRRATMGFTS
jgi:hypothetical protein